MVADSVGVGLGVPASEGVAVSVGVAVSNGGVNGSVP